MALPAVEIEDMEAEETLIDDTITDEAALDQLASLPPTMETCLAMNLVYQDLLEHKIGQVADAIKEKGGRVTAMKLEKEKALEANFVTKEFVRVPVLQYIPPYFRDSLGMAPMPNVDAQRKKERNELDPLVQPSKKWSNVEKTKLMDGVEAALVDMELSPLTIKMNTLIDELKTATPDENASMTNEIRKLEKKIEKAKNKFSVEMVASEAYERIDWARISVTAMRGTRTELECRLAFFNMFHPKLDYTKQWSEDELNTLRILAEEHNGYNWKSIAEKLGTNRTAFQCFEKYQSELNESILNKEWNEEDDNRLRDAVNNARLGTYICWEMVAGVMEGRTRAQCQMRWFRKLDPDLKTGRWSAEEDAILASAVQKYGVKGWRKIAKEVPGRTEAQCRERWNSGKKHGEKETRGKKDK